MKPAKNRILKFLKYFFCNIYNCSYHFCTLFFSTIFGKFKKIAKTTLLRHSLRALKIKDYRHFSYVSNNKAIPHIYFQKIRIKARGNSSEGFPKHNFTVEPSKKHRLAGLKSDDDWILNVSYLDKSFIRHKLSFDLFRQFDSTNIAPQCKYVEVYRNFRYWVSTF